MLIIVLGIIIIMYLLFTAYFKIKYRFWSIQPVFHFHNIGYWINPPGVIDKKKYKKHKKFFNPLVTFKRYNELNKIEKNELTELIENNYFKTSLAKYQPGDKGIHTYFKGHNVEPYVSYLNYHNLEKEKMIGAMTSRPCLFWLKNENFNLYYVDFLCVDKAHRKKNIAPQIIHSHIYHHKNTTNNQVMLFKREGPQTAIVPFTFYLSYYYDISHWTPNKINNNINIYLVDSKNFKNYYDIHIDLHTKFSCFSSTYIGNIKELIENKVLYIVMFEIDNEFKGVIYMKNAFTKHVDPLTNKTINMLEVMGSYIESDITETEVYHFLKYAVQLTNKEYYNGLLIENIGHNNKLLKVMFKKENYKQSFRVGWYLYNYATHPIRSNDVLMLQ